MGGCVLAREAAAAPPPPPPPQASTAPEPEAQGSVGETVAADYHTAKVEYDGREVSEAQEPEGGYLAVGVGDRVELLSDGAPGHGANRWPSYAYGRRLRDAEEGWIPVGCLMRS